ncbi:MAG: hypothetical protein AB4038_20960 [Prochloraceae cyanobacterium]
MQQNSKNSSRPSSSDNPYNKADLIFLLLPHR